MFIKIYKRRYLLEKINHLKFFATIKIVDKSLIQGTVHIWIMQENKDDVQKKLHSFRLGKIKLPLILHFQMIQKKLSSHQTDQKDNEILSKKD